MLRVVDIRSNASMLLESALTVTDPGNEVDIPLQQIATGRRTTLPNLCETLQPFRLAAPPDSRQTRTIRHSGQFTQRQRRRLGKRRLKNELVFLLQISRMAGCIQSA